VTSRRCLRVGPTLSKALHKVRCAGLFRVLEGPKQTSVACWVDVRQSRELIQFCKRIEFVLQTLATGGGALSFPCLSL
jgi:hypothetical protein